VNPGYITLIPHKHRPKIKILLMFVKVAPAFNMPKISDIEIGNESARMNKARFKMLKIKQSEIL
jgi:hypothetical protein